MSHIDGLQASVIVEHLSGRFNLYLSDITGVYYSLSLPDIVFDEDSGVDLELVSAVFIMAEEIQWNPSIKATIGE